MQDFIVVTGAKEHNLKDIDISIPRNELVVITGISGSGKSSLAFDTIYAEGQRRYLETFSTYARQFMGSMDRPEVESITGLSPVISIEQKTTGWNPRSTVGTITELYDFLRLLYARVGEAYSFTSGEKMVRFTEDEIIVLIDKQFKNNRIALLAPVVRGRKGHYRELFDQIRKQGFSKARVDGQFVDVTPGMQLDRYVTHDVEIVIDRIKVDPSRKDRLRTSLQTALKMGKEAVIVYNYDTEAENTFSKNLMDSVSGVSYADPNPNSFSFNSPYGSCPRCKGIGEIYQADVKKVMPDPSLSINKQGIAPFGEVRENWTFKQLRAIAKRYKFSFATPINDIPKEAMDIILNGGDESFQVKWNASKNDLVYNLAYEGLFNMLKIRSWAENFLTIHNCPECDGYRLKKESLHFKLANKHIGELAEMDLHALREWVSKLPKKLNKKQKLIAEELLKELNLRLSFLLDVGLDYMHLNRPARSLSGGEAQRTRLATQIGSKLTGITYIMDEPSIGLHQRDNARLIDALHELVDIGNTVIVVEHDKDIMLAADYLIDIGPGAGVNGGQIVGKGTPIQFLKGTSSTAAFLKNSQLIAVPKTRREGNGKFLKLLGAKGHNLKNVDLSIPLGTFICVTGVSGSGKSSLINETLYPILRQYFYKSIQRPLAYDKIDGIDEVDKVIEIDQSAIGRTPRSNPATYTGVFTDIRNLFTNIPEAKIRGYKAGRFSFNVKGGRCETCKGGGQRLIEMNFLPNVLVDCEICFGKRYNRETLEINYKGKNIGEVLEMSVSDAVEFFKQIPKIYRKLKTLDDVGLGYISLGQSATTLSGGEAQRVKLSEELSKRDTGNTLYIMDEPTTGLHFEDIQHLLVVIQRLVDKGNTVIIIEHNMDIIKVADYIIDIGPEGGQGGGTIVAQGTPELVAKSKKSHTAIYLKRELK
ncbi:UNVERIFIED_CONTAM: hypothetical protein GTU68_012616 [Idotea baltica]|nr:hypothetical protein [Idotea baltica]